MLILRRPALRFIQSRSQIGAHNGSELAHLNFVKESGESEINMKKGNPKLISVLLSGRAH